MPVGRPPLMNKLKYKEIEQEIRHLVETLPIGTKLPPERQLAVTPQCNCLTVRPALKTLVDEGLIVRRVGSGTFVAERAGEAGEGATPRGSRVGVLMHSDSDAYAHKLLHGISQVAGELRVSLRTGWMSDFKDESLRQAHALKQEGCVALTLPWFPHAAAEDVRGFVTRCPLPVSLPLLIPGREKNYFGDPGMYGLDLLPTTEALYRYFQALGRSRVALLGPRTPGDSILRKMLASYVCRAADEKQPAYLGLVNASSQSMDQLATEWKQHAGELAIISYDDEHALRFITSMHKIGLSAPRDFSIIGHNDTDASRFSDPALSTIRQDFAHIGRGLLKSALALSRGTVEQDNVSMPAKLVVRGSCGGAGRITAELRQQFPELSILEDAPARAEAARS
jgi:DNA-binding LacI/PurR family transcriptional regulator